jgi:creatinine amidohydrolase
MKCLPRAVFAALAVTVAQAALAQAPATVQLEDMTWTELRDSIRAGKTTLLIPIGGTEQSGPYVALGKHNARVRVLSERIAEGLGNAIVAPVIAYVPEGGYAPPTSHMRFPGTITVPDDAFEKTLESAANSFRVHGFTNIVFLGDHGGYQNDIKQSVARLNKSWAGTHAGLADTALLLAVEPRMVRVDKLRNAAKPGAVDGVYGGDPRHASVELGRLGTDAIVSRTVDAIRKEIAGR